MKNHGPKNTLSWSLCWFGSLILALSVGPFLVLGGGVAFSASAVYLPLTMNQTAPPGPGTRLVVFEGFYNPT